MLSHDRHIDMIALVINAHAACPPSRAEPSEKKQSEPSRAEPSRVEPSRGGPTIPDSLRIILDLFPIIPDLFLTILDYS